jgi:hypothetical protein
MLLAGAGVNPDFCVRLQKCRTAGGHDTQWDKPGCVGDSHDAQTARCRSVAGAGLQGGGERAGHSRRRDAAMIRVLPLAVLAALLPVSVAAQQAPCRFICELEWKLEPTVTIEHLANRHRVVTPDGVTERVNRERVFETVLALDLRTRVPRLGLTIESILSPSSEDNAVALEFETNFFVLRGPETGGWISSHVDVVDQFSPAERPNATRAYTHKLDLNGTPRSISSSGCLTNAGSTASRSKRLSTTSRPAAPGRATWSLTARGTSTTRVGGPCRSCSCCRSRHSRTSARRPRPSSSVLYRWPVTHTVPGNSIGIVDATREWPAVTT